MPTPTIEQQQTAIAQTQTELAQLHQRLADLRLTPAAPRADATTNEIIAASMASAESQAQNLPLIGGLEMAINRLQARLAELLAELAATQAKQTRQGHQAAAAAAQVELRDLGAALAEKVAEVRALVFKIKQVSTGDGGDSFKTLQLRPEPSGVGENFNPWRPAPLCKIDIPYLMPKLVERPDLSFFLGCENLDPLKAEHQEKVSTQIQGNNA